MRAKEGSILNCKFLQLNSNFEILLLNFFSPIKFDVFALVVNLKMTPISF